MFSSLIAQRFKVTPSPEGRDHLETEIPSCLEMWDQTHSMGLEDPACGRILLHFTSVNVEHAAVTLEELGCKYSDSLGSVWAAGFSFHCNINHKKSKICDFFLAIDRAGIRMRSWNYSQSDVHIKSFSYLPRKIFLLQRGLQELLLRVEHSSEGEKGSVFIIMWSVHTDCHV